MLPLVIQIERTKERVAETCAFAKSPVRVGRNPLNDVELDDGYVSQWHGVLRFDGENTMYLDLGSTNPTMVDGKPAARNVEIPISETTDLRIGAYRLHVIRAEAPPELFETRRKTAFARGDANGDRTGASYGGEPTLMRTREEMEAELSYARDVLSEGPRPSQSRPSGAVPPASVRPPGSRGQPAPGGTAIGVAALGRSLSVRPAKRPPPPPPGKRGPARSSVSVRPGMSGPSNEDRAPVLEMLADGNAAPTPSQAALAAQELIAARDSAVAALRSRPDPRDADGLDDHDSLLRAYDTYRQSWRPVLAELRYRLERATPPHRAQLLDQLLQRYPDINREPDFRALLSQLGLSPLRSGMPEIEDWLRRLTDGAFPPANAGINLALAMERIGELLEVFSTAFVEMRDAHARFCGEMSLDHPTDASPLLTTRNPQLALAYLLTPSRDGSSRVEELARSMADFALHQVALVSAVVEGSRGVLEQLAPKSLTQEANGGVFGGLFGSTGARLWQKYRARFDELMDEDGFTRRLFGKQFARKYYTIMGGQRVNISSGARSDRGGEG